MFNYKQNFDSISFNYLINCTRRINSHPHIILFYNILQFYGYKQNRFLKNFNSLYSYGEYYAINVLIFHINIHVLAPITNHNNLHYFLNLKLAKIPLPKFNLTSSSISPHFYLSIDQPIDRSIFEPSSNNDHSPS